MGHHHLELPFANVDVAAIHAGAAWVRSRVGVQVAAIDLSTGEVRHRLQLPATTLLNRSIRFAGQFLAANVERAEVRCLAVESGAQRWQRAGELLGSTPAGFVLAVRNESGPQASLLEVLPDGSARTLLDVPDAKHGLPRAVVTSRHVWTVTGKKLVGVPFRGSKGCSMPLETDDVGLLPWRDGVLVTESRQGRDGARTRLLSPDLETGQLRELATIPGKVFVPMTAAGDDVLVAVEVREGEEWDCLALVPGAADEPLRVTVPSYARAEARASMGAIAQQGALAVFSTKNARLRCLRVPLPIGSLPSVGVGDGLICAAVSKQLFVVEASALTAGDQDVEFAPLMAKAAGDPTPATVVFAGASIVAVDHPRLGRLNLKRTSPTPALAADDQVLLDAIREELPGELTVEAWHKKGERPSSGAAVGNVIRLQANQLPPTYARPAPPELGNLINLKRVSKRLSFSVPPELKRLAGEYDRDETFRDWLNQISLLVEITGLSTAWEGSDPCMLGLAGNGGGDVVSLYFYPPAHEAGGSLPVVDWWHETNEVSWLAPDFESYLAARLHEAREHAPDVVALILERLKLAPNFPAPLEAEAPPWFIAAHASKGKLPSLASIKKQAKEKPEQAERHLVRRLTESPDDAEARAALSELYSRLGWEWHQENLEQAED